jgi:alanyl-tRNA synthetase
LLSLERDQLRAQAIQIGERSIITTGFEGRTADDIRILANQLAELPLTIAVLVNRQGEQSAVAVSAATDSGIHAGNLLKAIVEHFGGRGGGRETYAQGTCPANDAATILATAHDQIKALLSS